MRKAGFRAAEGVASPSSAGGASVLTIPPVTPVGGCPKPPLGDNPFETYEDLLAFYEAAFAAQAGDQDQRDDFRNQWIMGALDLTDFIVDTYVMDWITYGYSGETATLTFLENNGCKIEVDIGRDPGSFWEQYAEGDSRFTERGIPVGGGLDLRFLVRNVGLSTGAVFESQPGPSDAGVNMNPEGSSPYPECTDGAETWTHNLNYLAFHDQPISHTVTFYRRNDTTGGIPESPAVYNFPTFWITSDKMMDQQIAPTIDVSGEGNGPLFGVIYVEGQAGLAYTGTYPTVFSSPHSDGNSDVTDWSVDSNFYECTDPVPPLVWEREYFCVAMPNPGTLDDPTSPTDTMRDIAPSKEAPDSRQMVDWSIDPAPGVGNRQDRYFQSWPLFRVTDVRVVGGGVSQPV